jgi:hypothetical protein
MIMSVYLYDMDKYKILNRCCLRSYFIIRRRKHESMLINLVSGMYNMIQIKTFRKFLLGKRVKEI